MEIESIHYTLIGVKSMLNRALRQGCCSSVQTVLYVIKIELVNESGIGLEDVGFH